MGKTKCIVLGEEPKEKKLKPIKLEMAIDVGINTARVVNALKLPNSYSILELVSRAHQPGLYDLILGHDGDRSAGVAYLGHWNDGVAE